MLKYLNLNALMISYKNSKKLTDVCNILTFKFIISHDNLLELNVLSLPNRGSYDISN